MAQIEISQLREIVKQLLGEDRRFINAERRATVRQPFFRPATVLLGRDQGDPQAAFVRDISEQGLGLVHDYPIEVGRFGTVALHRLWDDPIVFRCENRWCENWGSGWNISGWQILTLESI